MINVLLKTCVADDSIIWDNVKNDFQIYPPMSHNLADIELVHTAKT